MDRIDCIKTLIVVVETKSLTKASEHLNCNVSVVSRRISYLEKEIGEKLLLRTTRSLKLTDLGHRIYPNFKEVYDKYNQIELLSTQNEITGEIKISLPVALGRKLFFPELLRFNNQYKNLNISLFLEDDIINPNTDGFDFAIRFGRLQNSDYISKKLSSHKMMLAASPDYLNKYSTPKNISQLKAHTCLGFIFNNKKRIWSFKHKGKIVTFKPKDSLQTNDAELLCDAAVKGAGIVYLLDFIVTPYLNRKELTLIKLDGFEEIERPLHVIYKKDSKSKKKKRIFLEFLKSVL